MKAKKAMATPHIIEDPEQEISLEKRTELWEAYLKPERFDQKNHRGARATADLIKESIALQGATGPYLEAVMDMWHGIRDSHGNHFSDEIAARAALETVITTGHKAMLYDFVMEIIEQDRAKEQGGNVIAFKAKG